MTFWELGCMGLLEAPDGFFEGLPTVMSTFAYFILCPFSLMNLSYKRDYMSPTSPNKLLSLV